MIRLLDFATKKSLKVYALELLPPGLVREPIKVKTILPSRLNEQISGGQATKNKGKKFIGSPSVGRVSPAPPPLPKKIGEIVARPLGKPVSLSVLNSSKSSPQSTVQEEKKERKAPDIVGLREILESAMKQEDGNNNPKE